MDKLKAQIQAALDNGTLTGTVNFSDGSSLSAHGGGKHGAGVVVQPPPPPIVKPSVLATSGDLTLYADGSIGSAAIDAYNAGYKGPGQLAYGLFFDDAEQVFPQIASDPVLSGNVQHNRANLHSPLGLGTDKLGVVLQGSGATLAPSGHGYVHGSEHAIRGTLATRAKTRDIPALIDAWKAAGYYPVQVEQGASGQPFP